MVVGDTETYIPKMQRQINEGDEGDYELAKGNEKTLLRKIHLKLVAQLNRMGLTEFKDNTIPSDSPGDGKHVFLIKVHKENFPGRAVVSQIDDPTYNICKELTKKFKPISEAGNSLIKITYALKEILKMSIWMKIV